MDEQWRSAGGRRRPCSRRGPSEQPSTAASLLNGPNTTPPAYSAHLQSKRAQVQFPIGRANQIPSRRPRERTGVRHTTVHERTGVRRTAAVAGGRAAAGGCTAAAGRGSDAYRAWRICALPAPPPGPAVPVVHGGGGVAARPCVQRAGVAAGGRARRSPPFSRRPDPRSGKSVL